MYDHNYDQPTHTDRPTHLKIEVHPVFYDEDGRPLDNVTGFSLSGRDDSGDYTEGLWSGFLTIDEAIAAAPDFIRTTQIDGVVWNWRNAS